MSKYYNYVVCYRAEKTVLTENEQMLIDMMEREKVDINQNFYAIMEYNYKPLYEELEKLGGKRITTSTFLFEKSLYKSREELFNNIKVPVDLEYTVQVHIFSIDENYISIPDISSSQI